MGKLTFGQTGYSYETDRVEIKVHGAPRCARCNETVYVTEERKASGKSFHSRCLTCYQCRKALTTTSYHSYDDQLLCAACYKKATISKPAARGAEVTSSGGIERLTSTTQAATSRVTDAEGAWKNQSQSERHTGSIDYHHHIEVDRGDPSAYTETWVTCGDSVGGSSTNLSSRGSEDLNRDGLSPNQPDDRIFPDLLTNAKLNNTRDESNDDNSTPDTKMINSELDCPIGLNRSEELVLSDSNLNAQTRIECAELVSNVIMHNSLHKKEFNETLNSEPTMEGRVEKEPTKNGLDPTVSESILKDQIEKEITKVELNSPLQDLEISEPGNIEAVCYSLENRREYKRWASVGAGGFARSDRGAKARARFQSSTTVDRDAPECCPRCGARVYHAEEIMVRNRKWHKNCFRCDGSCGKTLVSGKYQEHQNSFYCEPCYRKHFGRYGGTRGSSLDLPSSQGSLMEIVEVFDDSLPSSLRKGFSSNQPTTPSIIVSGPLNEPVTLNVIQPIKGVQEWTEAFYIPNTKY